MKLERTFSIFAAGIGMIAGAILCWGYLAQTPKDMLSLTSPYSRIGYAPEQITSLAEQKAANVVGFALLLVAFFLEFVNLSFVSKRVEFLRSRCGGFFAIIGVLIVSLVVAFVAHKALSKHYKIEVGKVAVYDYLLRFDKTAGLSECQTLNVMTTELLGIKQQPSETTEAFVSRIVNLVGLQLPGKLASPVRPTR